MTSEALDEISRGEVPNADHTVHVTRREVLALDRDSDRRDSGITGFSLGRGQSPMSSCFYVPDADGFIFGPRDKLSIATECKGVDRIRMALKSLNDLSGGDIPYLRAGID